MTYERFTNFARSTVTAAMTNAQTTFSVAAGAGAKFPERDFHVTVDEEIMWCSSRSGDTFTVARGQKGTAAVSHLGGAIALHGPLAHHLEAAFNPLARDLARPKYENWIGATFQNGWVNYGAGYATGAYWKDPDGWVHLRGMIKSGTLGTAFTLPAGYAPPYEILYPIISNSAYGRIHIRTDGQVQISSPSSNPWVSLSGVSFQTGQTYTAPTLVNGWVDYGGAYAPAGYWLDPFGIVHLRGMVKSGTLGTTIFTMPDELRPSDGHIFLAARSGGLARVDVYAEGNVVGDTVDATWTSLDGICWPIRRAMRHWVPLGDGGYQNGWKAYSRRWNGPVSYFVNDYGVVYLVGMVDQGTVSGTLQVLDFPAGVAPFWNGGDELFAAISASAIGRVKIRFGRLYNESPSVNTYVSYAGMRFRGYAADYA